ncbi:MAG: type III-B CRISPR module-associated Cmr3 family protein [Moraxella sp.]|nr:type III-B CRISPR module-associated Cmr3 family protein [Moraxella sp.]
MKEKANINSYLIESLAPLVFRSGKPFGSQASAQDVIFPLSSAAAGLVRYLYLSQNNKTFPVDFYGEAYQDLLKIQSFGAFLVKFSDENDIQILVPKPANALYLDEKDDSGKLTGETLLVRLEPRAFDGENEQCGSDLPDNLLHIQIEPKFEQQKGKPAKGANFWTLEHFIQWQKGETLDFDTVNDNGITSIPTELRTHVAIDDDSLASVDGMLFQTASFDLAHQQKDGKWADKRLGFLLQTTKELKPDLATFGGERRLSHIKAVKNISLPFTPTQDDADKINELNGFSLAFITPCIFAKGALPAWIDKDTLTGTIPETGIKVQLKAMVIDRWQAVSGWDSLQWKPKATRRAVAAGSVYWFEIVSGQFDLPTLQKLSCHIWSDNDYDKYDGFGSAVLSAWQAPTQL